jgi:phage/plasmid-associated DNA primase
MKYIKNCFAKINEANTVETTTGALIADLLNEKVTESYELIDCDNKEYIKPYFDIDCKEGNKKTGQDFLKYGADPKSFLKENLKWLEQYFPDGEFAISSANRKDKLSYHIIVANYKCYMKDLLQLKLRFPCNVWDTAVYQSENSEPRKFRTIFSIKTEKDGTIQEQLQPLTFMEDESLYNHFITNPKKKAIEFIPPQPPTPKKDVSKCLLEITQPTSDNKTLGECLKNSNDLDRNIWFKVGVSLFNVLPEKVAREEFLKFTKQNNDKLKEADKTFDSIVKTGYTNGGWNLLKQYLPKAYHVRFLPKANPLPIDDADLDLGRYIKANFAEYKIKTYHGNVNSGSNKTWFKFENHRWIQTCETEQVKNLIHNFLCSKYDEEVKRVKNRLAGEQDKEQKDIIDKQLKQINKITKSIKGVAKMNKIMIILFDLYYDKDFREKLDQDVYLLGFTNGVYNLQEKEFRDGYPEDYISKTCGYDFNSSKDNEKIKYLEARLKEIFQGEGLYDAAMDSLSRNLIGDNSTNNQLFYCMYGTGSNGKSTVKTLLEEALGNYCTTLPSTFLTQKTQRADGCNMDTAQLVGTRFCLMSETEEGADINISTMKNFTGDKKVPYRPLYDSIRYTRITWSLWLLTNDKLKLPAGEAVARRFRYIFMKALFVDNPKEFKKNNKRTYIQKDIELMDNLPDYKMTFIHLLLDRLDSKKKIRFPKWVMLETEEIIKSQDKLTGLCDTWFEKAGEEYGISWIEMKRILKKDKMFHQLRYNSDQDLMDKISQRIGYAAFEKYSYSKSYMSNFKFTDMGSIKHIDNELKSKKFFTGIKLVIDDERDQECYIDN